MSRGGNGKTDRFRTVFEPEDIFDRFVKNANASTEASLPDEDEVTGCTPRESLRRGGPPSWDHRITVVAQEPRKPLEDAEDDTTRVGGEPVQAREFQASVEPDSLDLEDPTSAEDMTVPRASPLTTDSSPLTTDSGQRILLLTQVKPGSRLEPVTPPEAAPTMESVVFPEGEEAHDAGEVSSSHWQSVVAVRGQHTQRVEAAKLVPDVAASRRQDDPLPSETGEDGQMPTRELDQILSDMAVLLRYGHPAQVRDRLEQLRRAFPEDLLLLRRIAEFHVETDQTEAALDALFALARGLFERRNVEGMRQALEQVRVLDADNARAARLLGLLEARADGTDD